MDLVISALVGISFGILAARTRVPRIDWLPFIACILLYATLVVAYVQLQPTTQFAGLVLGLSTFVAASLYEPVLWKREELEPGVSYWGWLRRETFNPGYARRLYATVQNERLRYSTGNQRQP